MAGCLYPYRVEYFRKASVVMPATRTDLTKREDLPFSPYDWNIFFGCFPNHKPLNFGVPRERDLQSGFTNGLKAIKSGQEIELTEKKAWACLVLREQILNYNAPVKDTSKQQTMDHGRICGMNLEDGHRFQINQGFGLLWSFLSSFGWTSEGPHGQERYTNEEDWFKVLDLNSQISLPLVFEIAPVN